MSQSYCSRLCTFTVTISYSQQAPKIFIATTKESSNPLKLTPQTPACFQLALVTQCISKQCYLTALHSWCHQSLHVDYILHLQCLTGGSENQKASNPACGIVAVPLSPRQRHQGNKGGWSHGCSLLPKNKG